MAVRKRIKYWMEHIIGYIVCHNKSIFSHLYYKFLVQGTQ